MMGGFLYQSPKLQLILIMYSFIVGISIGIVYSVFDTISIMLNLHIVNESAGEEIKLRNAKNKIIISKIFQFSIDFFFSVVYTVITVIFIFCANKGRFRFFMLAFAAVGFCFQCGVQQMHFQQIIVANAEHLIPDQTFRFPDHRGQVIALKHIMHVEAVGLHIFDQILRSVTVITDFQRQDLVILNQTFKPRIAVVIVHKVIAGQLQNTALHIDAVGQAVSGCGLFQLFSRKEKLCKYVQNAVFFDYDRAGGQVGGSGKVDTADAVAFAEIVQIQHGAGCGFHIQGR